MKKIFLTFAVICLFTVSSAFAGWIHSSGYACNPETSEPGTCFWVEDEDPNRFAAPPADSDSVAESIKTFISDYNPFDSFLN